MGEVLTPPSLNLVATQSSTRCELLATFRSTKKQLAAAFPSPWLSGPTLTVTMIHGGRTRNAVPDECTIAVDFRILPGMDRRQTVDELFAALETLEIPITHSEFQCFAPP